MGACGTTSRSHLQRPPSRLTDIRLVWNGARNSDCANAKCGRIVRTLSAGTVRLLTAILGSALAVLPVFARADQQSQSPDQQNQQQPAPAEQQEAVAEPMPPQPSPNPTQRGFTIKEQQNIEHEKETGTSKDRLFWILPNFLTIESADQVPPLTAREKFETQARGLMDPSEFALMAVVAGLGQASNSIPQYGQGFEGYAKRYVTAYADNAVENMMASAVLPSLLHQDPRYYQLGEGGFARRTWHAFSRLFVTRSDSGKDEFNYSEVFGAGMAATISDYGYHPSGNQSAGNVANVWGTQMGLDYMTYMLKEFWPDLRRRFEKKHRPEPAQ